MKLKKDLILRNIAGVYIIVPIGKLSQIAPMMQITSSTAWLWQQIKDEEFTEDTLVEKVMSHFSGVTKEQAKKDIQAFLELLDRNYMLENEKPEPMMGTIKIELTTKQAEILEKSINK